MQVAKHCWRLCNKKWQFTDGTYIKNQDIVMTNNHQKVSQQQKSHASRHLSASAISLWNGSYLLTVCTFFSICDSIAGGVRSMTGKAPAWNIRINGQNDQKGMHGQNGVTNGMRLLVQMGLGSNKGRHGGEESMESGGTAHGARSTMARAGCTSMEEVAVASTGTRMWRKVHGTRGTHIMGLTSA